jgi:NAD-dependent dihydropyrimidine dehydrogenase PreA subunit
LALLREIGQAMRDASICGLGQTASSAIESALRQPGLVDDMTDSHHEPRHEDAVTHPWPPRPDEPIPEILLFPPARPSRPPEAPPVEAPPSVELTIDGQPVTVPAGTTDPRRVSAARHRHADPLLRRQPDAGQRLPRLRRRGRRRPGPRSGLFARGRAGMDVLTDSDRVRTSRKVVLEFLGSSVDVSIAGPAKPDGTIHEYMERYGADPSRFGPPAAPSAAGERDVHEAGHHHAPGPDEAAVAATVAQPTKIDNELYVRDYSKCILCYKCVEACGEDAQNTFAIAVAGRGFDARISTEQAVPLPESACVYCGNCIGVCPTGALMAKTEYDMRAEGSWDPSAQTVTSTICPYCGVGCVVDLHVQDERILKVTSPLDSSVTDGHLCIKGRFGFEFVNERPKAEGVPDVPTPSE